MRCLTNAIELECSVARSTYYLQFVVPMYVIPDDVLCFLGLKKSCKGIVDV